MAPTRTRKRKSDMSSPTTASPIKRQRKMGLSATQKQALIDNLQLERTLDSTLRHAIVCGKSHIHDTTLTLLQSRNALEGFGHNTISRRNTCDHASRCASTGYQMPSARRPSASCCPSPPSPKSQSLHGLSLQPGRRQSLLRMACHQSLWPGSLLQRLPRLGA